MKTIRAGHYLAALLFALHACIAHAASVIPLFLEELIDSSAIAFEGTVTGNRTGRDPATNLVVTYTTFEVREVLKGSIGPTHEIKQVGGALPDDSLQYRVLGVPSFAEGESYVVFLAGKSSAGFSSPMGLSQGRFRIQGEKADRAVANGRYFRDMARNISERLPATARERIAQAGGPVREMGLEEFKQAVRNHLQAKQ